MHVISCHSVNKLINIINCNVIYLPASLSIHPSSIHIFTHPSLHLNIHPSTHLWHTDTLPPNTWWGRQCRPWTCQGRRQGSSTDSSSFPNKPRPWYRWRHWSNRGSQSRPWCTDLRSSCRTEPSSSGWPRCLDILLQRILWRSNLWFMNNNISNLVIIIITTIIILIIIKLLWR